MEDTFKLRVDKAFGSLSSPSPSVSFPVPSPVFSSSLWCLTDEEIEKKEWNRGKGQSELESSTNGEDTAALDKSLRSYDELEEDIEELEDDDDVKGGDDASGMLKESDKPEDHDDEEWQIRSSLGLDCTLDYEDEEDEFDKVAVGKEKKAGDRLFVDQVNECPSNSYNELPVSLNEVVKDSRADLVAAKLRLKEEEEEANGSYKTQQVVNYSKFNASANVSNLKSVLKKEKNSELNLQKRVRFDTECKNEEEDSSKKTCLMEEAPTLDETSLVAVVPDYVRNPSNYTCYTFDSPKEVDEDLNQQAFMDCLNLVQKSKATPMDEEPEDASVDLPKSVTFIPRKKAGEAIIVKTETEPNHNERDAGMGSIQKKNLPVSIVVGEVEETEVCDMDEDVPETLAENSSSGSRTSGRHYRFKGRA